MQYTRPDIFGQDDYDEPIRPSHHTTKPSVLQRRPAIKNIDTANRTRRIKQGYQDWLSLKHLEMAYTTILGPIRPSQPPNGVYHSRPGGTK